MPTLVPPVLVHQLIVLHVAMDQPIETPNQVVLVKLVIINQIKIVCNVILNALPVHLQLIIVLHVKLGLEEI